MLQGCGPSNGVGANSGGGAKEVAIDAGGGPGTPGPGPLGNADFGGGPGCGRASGGGAWKPSPRCDISSSLAKGQRAGADNNLRKNGYGRVHACHEVPRQTTMFGKLPPGTTHKFTTITVLNILVPRGLNGIMLKRATSKSHRGKTPRDVRPEVSPHAECMEGAVYSTHDRWGVPL